MNTLMHVDHFDPEFESLLRVVCSELVERPSDEEREILTQDLEQE